MRLWTKRCDGEVHPQAGVLTYGIGTRPMLMQRPREEIEASLAAIPDPARRAARRSVIDHGVKAPEMEGALRAFVTMLDGMESSLAAGDYLAGPDWSLADASLLPYVLRLDHLAMTPLIEARERVAAWYARMRARDSYAVAVEAFVPEPLVANFRAQGEAVWKDVEALVDGLGRAR